MTATATRGGAEVSALRGLGSGHLSLGIARGTERAVIVLSVFALFINNTDIYLKVLSFRYLTFESKQ